jgi:two-component system, OmpR family, sensor histidine kinase KdpD
MRILRKIFRTPAIYPLWAILLTGLITIILRLLVNSLSIQVIALLYLFPVMISVAFWGLTSSFFAALLAFLAFNYYFIPPYHNFTVHRTQDLVTLIIFLIVAVVISQLLGSAKKALAQASDREREATCLYELTIALAGMQDNQIIACTLVHHAQSTFLASNVSVKIDARFGEPEITECSSVVEAPDSRPICIPLQTARGREGEISLWREEHPLSISEERLLQTFASQAALSIERTRLTKSENRAKILEESDRLKSALLSSVSHELRSPLATIKASVSSLRSGEVTWDNEARQDLLMAIEEETDHLNLLVGNLLDMSRIETGALKLLRKWNSLSEIIDTVLKRWRQSIQHHPIILDIPADLPPLPTDYSLMEQVFINLLSNSVKYAPEGTEIIIRAYPPKMGNVLIQIINQSPALAEQDLDRIFEKFYRVTAADRVTGTGLGLSICKGIIQTHGGQIWAENTPEGFTFNFTLPAVWEGEHPYLPQEQAG